MSGDLRRATIEKIEDFLAGKVSKAEAASWAVGILTERAFGTDELVLEDAITALAGLHDEDEFSMSFGGGVKVWINNHVGFRFEGRGYWTDLGSAEDEWQFWDEYDDDLYQAEVKVGLVISF